MSEREVRSLLPTHEIQIGPDEQNAWLQRQGTVWTLVVWGDARPQTVNFAANSDELHHAIDALVEADI